MCLSLRILYLQLLNIFGELWCWLSTLKCCFLFCKSWNPKLIFYFGISYPVVWQKIYRRFGNTCCFIFCPEDESSKFLRQIAFQNTTLFAVTFAGIKSLTASSALREIHIALQGYFIKRYNKICTSKIHKTINWGIGLYVLTEIINTMN